MTARDTIGPMLIAFLPTMRRFALSLTRAPDQADDLVQAACERALLSAESFQPGTRFDAWMFRIVRNLWIDRLRRVKTQAAVPVALLSIGASVDWRAIARMDRFEAALNAIKLIVLPGATLLGATVLAVGPGPRMVLTLFAALPTASAAHVLGMEVAGLSCITNKAAGLSGQPLSHEEVLRTVKKQSATLARLLARLVEVV